MMEVSYGGDSDSLMVADGSNSYSFSYDYWHNCPEIVKEYHYWGYPTHTALTQYEDKYKKAFNIAKLLLKEKLLVSRRLGDFIKLVDKIAKEL